VPSRNKAAGVGPADRAAPGSLAVVTLLLSIAPVLLIASSTSLAAAAPSRAPDEAQITRAINAVKADPNLATERTVRTLKWADESQPQPSSAPTSLAWLVQFIEWFAQSARILVWVAVAILAGMLAIYLVRLTRSHRPTKVNRATAPTHVQDLDIRPESLPDNIGAASRTLWDSGEHRAALSLLYRGVLSRLVHVHNLPIRDSSTEGDCLRLAAARLREEQRNYVDRLIQIWQHAVYGGQQPETASLYTLCDGFAPALDAA
jgi:hypothetical protein